jgi:pimeloyl-ACP methyl ester carboxylesterase
MKSGWKRFLMTISILFFVLAGVYFLVNVETKTLNEDSKKTAPGEFLKLPAGEVHYRLVGQENHPLVVLVHGFSVPSYVWDPTVSALEESGYQVLIYDLFGRGFSERIEGEYDIDLFSSQLNDLLNALGLNQSVAVIGLSMGGPVTAQFTSMYPEKVSRVILLAPEVMQPTTGDIFPLNVPLVGEYLMGAMMEPFLLPKMQAADFVHPEYFPDWEALYRVQLQYHGTGRALLSTIRNLTKHDPLEDYRALDEVGIPVLVIWGEEDQTISWDQIETLSQVLNNLQIETVSSAGHLAHYERPDVVNPLLIDFLRDIEGLND